jgi:hypothetical protein
MIDFKDTYCGEWRTGQRPLDLIGHSVCKISIGKDHFIHLVPVYEVDRFKEWLVIGNWFGDDLPEYDTHFEGTIDDYFSVIGLNFVEIPLAWAHISGFTRTDEDDG